MSDKDTDIRDSQTNRYLGWLRFSLRMEPSQARSGYGEATCLKHT
jgi:hypothetical protein